MKKAFDRLAAPICLLLIMSVLLSFLSGCTQAPPEQSTEPTSNTEDKTEAEQKTEAETPKRPMGEAEEPTNKKEYFSIPYEYYDFRDDTIVIELFDGYQYIDYTVDDFKDIGCIEIRKQTYEYHAWFTLKLSTKSKQNVLDTVRIIENQRRKEVRYVHPSEIFSPPPYDDYDFRDNKIYFALFRGYQDTEYTIEDFKEIGCIKIEKKTNNDLAWFVLTLSVNSKQNVLDMIKILEQQDREEIAQILPVEIARPC